MKDLFSDLGKQIEDIEAEIIELQAEKPDVRLRGVIDRWAEKLKKTFKKVRRIKLIFYF